MIHPRKTYYAFICFICMFKESVYVPAVSLKLDFTVTGQRIYIVTVYSALLVNKPSPHMKNDVGCLFLRIFFLKSVFPIISVPFPIVYLWTLRSLQQNVPSNFPYFLPTFFSCYIQTLYQKWKKVGYQHNLYEIKEPIFNLL